MSVTVTIEQTSPQANAIIEMLRTFDFVTFKEPKKAKTLAAPTQYVASDEILDLSRKINKKMTDRMRKHFNI